MNLSSTTPWTLETTPCDLCLRFDCDTCRIFKNTDYVYAMAKNGRAPELWTVAMARKVRFDIKL